MTKREFLDELKKGLKGLPEKDIDERVAFYGEMIDDCIEEGATESDAVAKIGEVKEVVKEIISDIPLKNIIKEKVSPKRKMKGYEIVVIALGFPLWFPLLISLFALFIALYAALWSLAAAVWAVVIALAASCLGGIFFAAVKLFQGYGSAAVAALGIGVAAVGLAIFAFYGASAATKVTALIPKKAFLPLKRLFIGKGD